MALKQSAIDNTSFSSTPYIEYNNDLNLPKNYYFKGAVYSKTRDPLEEFTYKNAYVFLYRLPIVSNKLLPEILKVVHNQTNPTRYIDYIDLIGPFIAIDYSSYNIIYRAGKPIPGNEINLNLEDNHFKVLKQTDTVYSCYTQIGHFSMNYNSSDTLDFYGEKKFEAKPTSLPVQIIFAKKHDHYYVFIIIAKE